MATVAKRICDLCGNAVQDPQEPMGYLYLPSGTQEHINARVQAELQRRVNDNPLLIVSGHAQRLGEEIYRELSGQRWDVCKQCVEGLTAVAGARLMAWMAAGFFKKQE
jgi:hypothetical protein